MGVRNCHLRKPLPQKVRQAVYDKYHGHCAYCGKEIDFKDMQVDHITGYGAAFYGVNGENVLQMIEDGSINAIDNLLPSCRRCNYYKGPFDIEALRQRILTELEHTCRQTFSTQLAIQYGMISYQPWDGVFYFERQKQTI